ncbi:hypothetical protein DEJ47_14530 [Streptomyces venezuelae]|uniref:Uncharacterized protein n=1 Tax=Streptomyces venezuelae TaxID=54571 RepID=A0A5P2BCM5_STRVZ|nr:MULTISPECIES: hypothetical protein [unclassified Streptomyces]QES27508.1 hypothetical protein DEJ47_14530 [Streptomyces venezuelae]
MHPDVHLMLHEERAERLRRAAPPRRVRRRRLRAQVGWRLVELGLRLVSSSGPSRPFPAPAARRPFPSAS